MFGAVVLNTIVFLSCRSDHNMPTLVSSETLFETFEEASRLTRRRVRDANLDGCGYHYGGGADYPAVAFEWVLSTFTGAVYDAQEDTSSLQRTHAALLTFVHDTDSIIQLAYPKDAYYILIEPQLSDWMRKNPVFNAPSDTTLLMVEATRVLLLATYSLAGGQKICGIGNDIPYVVVSPLPQTDSFTVRVGLRMPDLCPSPSNYAIVFGDTLLYTSWADTYGTFHRDMLKGLDTLTVKSCLGNPLTGMKWCQEKWTLVGW